MNVFQLIVVPALFGVAAYLLYLWRTQRRRRFGWAGLVFILAAVTVIRPALTSEAARLLGIGRGTDLITYLTALGLLGLFLNVLWVQRNARLQITELTRQLALRELESQGHAAPPAAARPHEQSGHQRAG